MLLKFNFNKLRDKIIKLAGDHSRLLHFVFGFMASAWLTDKFGAWILLGGAATGLTKESYDKFYRKNKFDWWDVFWTQIGFLAGFLVRTIAGFEIKY